MVKVVIRETLELLPWMFQSIYFSNKKKFFVSPILQMEVQCLQTCSYLVARVYRIKFRKELNSWSCLTPKGLNIKEEFKIL